MMTQAERDAERFLELARDNPPAPELHRRLLGKGLGTARAREAAKELMRRRLRLVEPS